MERTKSPIDTELNAEVPLSDDPNVSLNAMTRHRMKIMQQFGDGRPYERDHIVYETRFYMVQSAEVTLGAGKRLIVLRENEPHGDFVGIIEGQFDLHVRTAQRMMKASLKYLPSELEPKATMLSLLGKAKLFELVAEDDDDLAGLADGGTVAGLTLDDVDRMSVCELRQTLRGARETNAAQRRALADKNERIDSLSTRPEEKSRIQPPKPDEEVKKLWAEMTALAVEAGSAIAVRLSSAFEALYVYCAENMIDIPRDFIVGLVCQLGSTTRSLRSTFGPPDEPTDNAAPSWLIRPTPQINGLKA